jgi:choline-sulfatase
LAKAGYDTYFTGKWHIQTDAEKCFRVAKNVRAGMPKTVKNAYYRPSANEPDTWSPFDESQGGYWQGGKHWSEVVADDAVEFISQAKARPQPFFMYVAFNAPHDPRQSPEEFVRKFPPEKLAVPKNYLPEYPHKEMMGAGKGLRDEQLAPFPRTEHAVQVHRGEYYALIAHLDVQLGRILDSLEASGKGANTWIFFTADHGLAVGQHGLMGKQNQYDHSVRVPFLVAGPGVTAGKKVAASIYLQDVVPTTLELANAEKPKHVWFQSLLPLLRGERTASAYDAVYGSYLDQQRAITADGFKLIVYPRGKVQKLFDLQRDPEEMHDLAAVEAHQPTLAKLQAKLTQLQMDLTDPLLIKKD